MELRAPNLAEVDQWQAAFISSTSRLLLPVDCVVYGGSGGEEQRVGWPQRHPLVAQLEEGVLGKVLAASEPLPVLV